MDFGTAIGLVAGLAIITVGVIRGGGDLYWFVNFNSILIVFGGTFAATLVNYPVKHVLGLYHVIKIVFTREIHDYHDMINQIVEKAEKARKMGVMALEADLPTIEDSFLRNGIELAINERDSGLLRTYLRLELSNIDRRHAMGQEIFFYMGTYAPAFGMLGTIIGLIIMMNNFSGAGNGQEMDAMSFDVAQKFAELLGGMGLALITTFYGVLLANLLFLPLGGKLRRKSENEMMLKNIVVEGIISIHKKDHPLLIKEKLMTFVPRTQRNVEE